MKSNIYEVAVCALLLLILHIPLCVNAQNNKPKKAIARSIYYGVPDGYSQLGNTDLFYRLTSNSIDFIGRFSSQYYSSTYSDGGYRLAMQVGNNSAIQVDCLYGSTVDGVSCSISVAPQWELGRVVYTVTNTNSEDVIVSLGTHADVMIGSNDSAPISRRTDTIGNTYGLTMEDGNGAELCVLFGAGLVGVNSVSDFWFGRYYTNTEPYQMVGNYTAGDYYMVENGSYDSGMGWCWKERSVPANSSVEFSYLIGVGDVNLEPNSSFEVTPEDPDGWNDLSRPHRLTLEGEYESPAGQNGKIQYAVEDSEDWQDLTEELPSGSNFTASLVVMFDANKENHTIRFRTMDAVGNTSMLTPFVYKDVSYHPVAGIEEKAYNWGDSIYQSNLMCDLPSDQYVIADYKNNINAGIATFNIEGVFPYSIGRKTYSFTINPLPIDGQLLLDESLFVYNGGSHCPAWTFSNSIFNQLEVGSNYTVEWLNNVLPGTASLRVQGIGNFSNELIADFFIDKAQLTPELYSIYLPNEDVTYDGNPHGAVVSAVAGVGVSTIYYSPSGQEALTTVEPTDNGTYDIYLEFADGELYYGRKQEKIYTFTIYLFDEADWAAIQALAPVLTNQGWATPWDLSGGIVSASHLDGLTIEYGRVVGLDLSNASLTGTLPVELFALSNLCSLNLSGNSFEGAVDALASFAQQNPAVFGSLFELNIANNALSGNLGVMAACFPSLISLDAHGNCLADIYPMISSQVTTLDISGQTIDRTVEYDLSNTTLEELAQQIPTILVYDHTAQGYTKPLSLRCTMDDGFSMTLSYQNGNIAIKDVSEQNAYHGKSGDILDVEALTDDAYSKSSTLKLKLIFASGDANFLNGLDITDLQSTILYAFSDYPTYMPFNFTAADTYTDMVINVQDVVSTVNILLAVTGVNEVSAMKTAPSSMTANDGYEEENMIWIEDGRIFVKATAPIAAMSIDISSSAELNLSEYGMTVSSNGMRTIAYSLTGGYIPEGIVEIGSCKSDARIVSVAMSTVDAQLMRVSIGANGTSAIDGTMPNNDATYEIYTPGGIRIAKPMHGVNIIKYPDNQISKIYVR